MIIRFPASLEVKDVIVDDKFSDWQDTLTCSRHQNIHEHISLTLRANVDKQKQFWINTQADLQKHQHVSSPEPMDLMAQLQGTNQLNIPRNMDHGA